MRFLCDPAHSWWFFVVFLLLWTGSRRWYSSQVRAPWILQFPLETESRQPELMHQLRGHFTVLNPNPDDLAIIEDNGNISTGTLHSFDPQIRTKMPYSHPPSAEKRKLASIGTRQHPARTWFWVSHVHTVGIHYSLGLPLFPSRTSWFLL
jgi:hypothetical protein